MIYQSTRATTVRICAAEISKHRPQTCLSFSLSQAAYRAHMSSTDKADAVANSAQASTSVSDAKFDANNSPNSSSPPAGLSEQQSATAALSDALLTLLTKMGLSVTNFLLSGDIGVIVEPVSAEGRAAREELVRLLLTSPPLVATCPSLTGRLLNRLCDSPAVLARVAETDALFQLPLPMDVIYTTVLRMAAQRKVYQWILCAC